MSSGIGLPKNLTKDQVYIQGVQDGHDAALADVRRALHEYRDNLVHEAIVSRTPLGPTILVASSSILDGVTSLIDKLEDKTAAVFDKYTLAVQTAAIAQAASDKVNSGTTGE